MTSTHPDTVAATPSAVDVVDAFNDAFNRHDVDAVMALMTADCVFDGTAPPDGRLHVGSAAVRAAWEAFFAASPSARFTAEEVLAAGNRVIVRWRYDWNDPGSDPGHVRGIDLFRIDGGHVAEKLAYVKG
jgi:ketosteroid isomerase-like protein